MLGVATLFITQNTNANDGPDYQKQVSFNIAGKGGNIGTPAGTEFSYGSDMWRISHLSVTKANASDPDDEVTFLNFKVQPQKKSGSTWSTAKFSDVLLPRLGPQILVNPPSSVSSSNCGGFWIDFAPGKTTWDGSRYSLSGFRGGWSASKAALTM